MSQLTIQQAIELGLGNFQAGRVDAAESVFQQILSHDPNQPDALHLLGIIASASGRHLIAAELIERAIQVAPQNATFHCNLGQVLVTLGRWDEAMQALETALRLDPNHFVALSNLGNLLTLQGRLDAAVHSLRHAIAVKPQYLQAHLNLAAAMEKQADWDGAIEQYRAILRFKPDYVEAYNNLANALGHCAKLDDSLAVLRQAITLRPEFVTAHSNLLYSLHFHPDYDRQRLKEEHEQFNLRHAEPLKASILPHGNDPNADRKLRIGHVSCNFREHCQMLFAFPLLSNHNHETFEIHCYSDVAKPDAYTERLKRYADVWHDITALSDQEVAEMIRGDQIDILVDHTMHMHGGRPLLFARKPAPIQVAWLAYPGSTGMTAVDYRLTDPHLDPPGEGDRFYAETSIRLPHSFWCYDPRAGDPEADIPPVSALPAELNGFITFGCLNNFNKLNEITLRLWREVLTQVENSRLHLLAPRGSCREWVLHALGVPARRVEFISFQPRAQYLREYQRIDIALDTVPYTGHTTSLDSLWMGVPVVTLAGQTAVSRGGLSLLSSVDATELVATRADEFVRIATTLAQNRDRLTDLRRSLRDRMQRSPLMNAPQFARHFEAAMCQMWQVWIGTEKERPTRVHD